MFKCNNMGIMFGEKNKRHAETSVGRTSKFSEYILFIFFVYYFWRLMGTILFSNIYLGTIH